MMMSKAKNKRRSSDDELMEPRMKELPSTIMRTIIQSHNGTPPVFLYGKYLKESDVAQQQNRLLITRDEYFENFLSVEEWARAGSPEGIEVPTIGPNNKPYTLRLKKWTSINNLILNVDWHAMVRDNGVKGGHRLDLWGYRQNSTNGFILRFFANFMKPSADRDNSGFTEDVGSSSSSGGGYTSDELEAAEGLLLLKERYYSRDRFRDTIRV